MKGKGVLGDQSCSYEMIEYYWVDHRSRMVFLFHFKKNKVIKIGVHISNNDNFEGVSLQLSRTPFLEHTLNHGLLLHR